RREDLFGRQLQDQIARFEFEMSQDPQALDQYINRLTQLSSGFSTQSVTQPRASTNIFETALGGLKTGLGLYGAYKDPTGTLKQLLGGK
ncbi:MAG: hypothetical protein VKL39_16365, partial [Leptolyngbyaceae bacterium]|nr:hypothetical protein [Leptolyngbyaceae bacterium]